MYVLVLESLIPMMRGVTPTHNKTTDMNLHTKVQSLNINIHKYNKEFGSKGKVYSPQAKYFQAR